MRTLKFILLGCGVLLYAASAGFARGGDVSYPATVAQIHSKLSHLGVENAKHGNVQAEFQNGVLILTGTVESVGVKSDVEKAVRKAAGVDSVVDQLTVNTDDATPRLIAEQARHDILTYPFYTIFDNIELRIEGNNLTVSGQVTQPFKKSDIGNILSHLRGVTGFENDLEVLPNLQMDDQIRQAVARAIYRDPFFVNYGNQALPPIHIIVKNGNVTLDGVVDTALARTKAEIDARFAATYFGLTNNLRLEQPAHS
jgi:hyperosmotically inducible periplasmic protein